MGRNSRIFLWLTIIGIVFTGGSFSMDLIKFNLKIDPSRIQEEIQKFEEELKKIPSISENFAPDYDIEINDLNFKMNITFDENQSTANMNNSIWNYKPGEYRLSDNNDGRAILKLIEFKIDEFINDDVIIKVEARGTSDGIPVKYGTKYNGEYGDQVLIHYYNDIEQEYSVLLEAGKTNMKNEYFALLRAYDVVTSLKKKYPIDNNNIRIYVKEFSQVGAEYRRCDLTINVENAFLKDYKDLNPVIKFFIGKD